jgi:preprotein translocase subunit SecD
MTTELTPTITDDEVAELPLTEARADLLRELLASTGAASEPVRRPRRWPAALAAAAAVVAVAVPVGLSQLGGDDSGTVTDPGTASEPPPPPPAAFQVRVVGLTSAKPKRDDSEWQELAAFTCPVRPTAAPADKAELACDADGTKYLLGAAAVEDGVVAAQAIQAQAGAGWTVALQLDEKATGELRDLTRELVGSTTQVALVLDGEVLSAPSIMSVIENGQLQLAGDFTKTEATELAARLGE